MTDPVPTASRGVGSMLALAAVVVLVVLGCTRGVWVPNLHNGVLAVAFAAVGSHVRYQRPGHRAGLLFQLTGVVEAVLFAGRQVGHDPVGPASRWWGWFGVWPVVVGLALTTVCVLVFPDGRLPSPRWRWVVVALAVLTVACATLSALWPVEYAAAGVRTEHPLDLPGAEGAERLWSGLAHPAYVGMQVLWVVALALRWRPAGRVVRQQIVVVAVAASASVVALLIGLVGWSTPRPGVLVASLVPLAAGWAIVHGQHATAYTALSWMSRAGSELQDLPTGLAKNLAEALGATSATLWAGPADRLLAVGSWPEDEARAESETADSLRAAPDTVLRLVPAASTDPRTSGAISVRRRGSTVSLSESRLLADVAAQATLVIAHLDAAALVEGQRREGRLADLTPREQDVLRLMAGGLSNAAIAAKLHLSVKSVEPVVGAIFTKLRLHTDASSNRRVLAVLAYVRSERAPSDPTPSS